MSVEPDDGKAKKFGFIVVLLASRRLPFALNHENGGSYHLSPDVVPQGMIHLS